MTNYSQTRPKMPVAGHTVTLKMRFGSPSMVKLSAVLTMLCRLELYKKTETFKVLKIESFLE